MERRAFLAAVCGVVAAPFVPGPKTVPSPRLVFRADAPGVVMDRAIGISMRYVKQYDFSQPHGVRIMEP